MDDHTEFSDTRKQTRIYDHPSPNKDSEAGESSGTLLPVETYHLGKELQVCSGENTELVPSSVTLLSVEISDLGQEVQLHYGETTQTEMATDSIEATSLNTATGSPESSTRSEHRRVVRRRSKITGDVLGLRQWYPNLESEIDLDDDYICDIISVAGAGAHPRDTWVMKKGFEEWEVKHNPGIQKGVNWLTELLPQSLQKRNQKIRLLNFGYSSHWFGENAVKTTLRATGTGLMRAIKNERAGKKWMTRPIVFIAHSLGGLVVIKALNELEASSILNVTTGIVFLATPFRGTDDEVWKNQIAALKSANEHTLITVLPNVMELLDPDCEIVGEALDRFVKTQNGQSCAKRIEVFCFYEAQVAAPGKMVFIPAEDGESLPELIIVTRTSGVLDGAEHDSLPLTHFTINKFSSEGHGNYLKVLAEIEKMVQNCGSIIESRRRDSTGFNIPFNLIGVLKTDNFVERKFETSELEQRLLPQRKGGLGKQQRKTFVLYGLGGIGKTQLAINFARHHRNSFSAVFWLDGTSKDTLRLSFAANAGRIPGINRQLTSEDDLNTAVNDMKDWLAKPKNEEWLLIFDSVDRDHQEDCEFGAYEIDDYMSGDHGSVLITSRLFQLAKLYDSLELTKTNESLGRCIFQKWYGQAPGADISELLQLLDGLPLAIAQAASYLRQTPIDIVSYIELYHKEWGRLMQLDANPPGDYKKGSVGTTWMISFKAIQAKSPYSANLLLLWAYFNNKKLHRRLFQAVSNDKKCWPKWLQELATDQINFYNAVALLREYSMIEPQDGEHDSFAVHPVVHKWASYIQDDKQKSEFLQLAVMVVGLSVPSQSTKNYWILQQELLLHADICSQWLQKQQVKSVKMGTSYGRWMDTKRLLYRLSSDVGSRLMRKQDTTNGEKGTSYHGESDMMRQLGRLYSYVCPWLRQKQHTTNSEMKIHVYGREMDAIHRLGRLYSNQGRQKVAEEMYLLALQGKERAFGPNHKSTLQTVNNLGAIYMSQEKFQAAEQMNLRALRGQEKAFGPDDESTLSAVNNLGLLRFKEGKLAEAEELYTRALQGREKALGLDDKQTLQTVHNIGTLYRSQGKWHEAEEMYLLALRGRGKEYGADHTSTLDTVNCLGILYFNQGKFKEAEDLYQRALQGREKALGPNHTCTLQTVQCLNELHAVQEKMREAEDRRCPNGDDPLAPSRSKETSSL